MLTRNCSDSGICAAIYAMSALQKHPAAWFFVVDFLVKLCSHDSFKHILRLFWVGKKKCYALLEC